MVKANPKTTAVAESWRGPVQTGPDQKANVLHILTRDLHTNGGVLGDELVTNI